MIRARLISIAGIALIAACSSGGGADVNSFPTSLAQSVCHFYYHCCTPVDRELVSAFPVVDGGGGYSSGFMQAAALLGFDDEGSCKAKLPALLQTSAQSYQEEVQRNRYTYDQAKAQHCLDVVNGAGDKCDPKSFFEARPPFGDLVDTSIPPTVYIVDAGPSICDALTFLTGHVADNNSCTNSAECLTGGAICAPAAVDGGMGGLDGGPHVTDINSSAGVCIPPAGIARPCSPTGGPGATCAPGSCCGPDGDGGLICVSYVPENGMCSDDNIAVNGVTCNNVCALKPCNPVTDYCRMASQGGGGTCTARIADGQACDSNDNQTPSCSCQHSCQMGTLCVGQAQVTNYQVCTGNPSGI